VIIQEARTGVEERAVVEDNISQEQVNPVVIVGPLHIGQPGAQNHGSVGIVEARTM
jgi:hypothetical protein